MGKILIIMGKTSSGKDTVFRRVMEGVKAPLKTVVTYTTRPMRPGEQDGEEYFFVDEEKLKALRAEGKVIEERLYNTVHGPWYYFTVNDGQIDLETSNYLLITTLAGYEQIRAYYGEENVAPFYIEADAKDRLIRYINREEKQKNPNYCEVCRRFLADEADFSEDELVRLGIVNRYYNKDLDKCCQSVVADIEKLM